MKREIYKLIKNYKFQEITKYYASFDCDNCHKKVTKPQCKACHRMVNYFKVFDIPQNYKVDTSEIADKAKQLQKQFHPDKNHNSQMNDKYSSYINSAKSTLLDDLKRAEYLLSLRGININQDQSTISDSAFMVDMFELQEEIQDIKSNDQMNKMKKRIEDILDNVKGQINHMFETQNNQKCMQFIQKYRYLYCALENLKKKMQIQI